MNYPQFENHTEPLVETNIGFIVQIKLNFTLQQHYSIIFLWSQT